MSKYFERLNDIVILQLNTDGFENLTEKEKALAYHLAEAGLWGRCISVDQGSKYNLEMFDSLISLYEKAPDGKAKEIVRESLFVFFAHNGVYHSMSGEKLEVPLTQEVLKELKEFDSESVDFISNVWFSEAIPRFRTIQKEGVDVVAESGGNFYEGLTTQEVTDFRKENYPSDGDQLPPYGFNERLVKVDGNIERQVISKNGLYAKYVEKIIESLQKAVKFAENEEQKLSIETLIKFYETGDAKDFDTHCVAWTKDQKSNVYFINGLIESYEDPLGIGCTFESIVAFKNPLQTAKVNKVIENIQYFEDNLPFDKKFKKEKALGLSASSITVVSSAGETAPSLPLGINLPNSDWIRKVHGSKSVSLANVSAGRSTYEVPLREALYLPKYHGVMEKYLNMTNELHTDLHEIAGHGSGKVLEGVNTEILGVYYSVIEETRADLVALYYMGDEKLKEFGVVDSDVNMREAALAQYVGYITNGAIGQLRRVALGNELTQAHFRNRQLISTWVLDHAEPEKVVMKTKGGSFYIEVNDIDYVRDLFGQLLSKIQEIKSTGDLEGAANLVNKYGTVVNQEVHKEIISRIEKLDMPKVTAFNTPIIVQNGNNYKIEQVTDFLQQQIDLYKDYSLKFGLEKTNNNISTLSSDFVSRMKKKK